MNKKNLYIHIGPLKTGTTSLQNYCYINRDYLLDNGLLYPISGLTVRRESDPKHQILISHLMSGNLSELEKWLSELRIESENCDQIDQVLISAEGFYNHFYDFGNTIEHFISTLKKYFNVKVIFFYRRLSDYFKSYYKQILCNPPINDDLGYGMDLSPSEFYNLPRIKENLNFAQILKDYTKLVGRENMLIFNYINGFTIEQLMKYFKIPVLQYKSLNTSVPDSSVSTLIEYNKHVDGPSDKDEFLRTLKKSNDDSGGEEIQLVSDSITQELQHKEDFWMSEVKRQYSWI